MKNESFIKEYFDIYIKLQRMSFDMNQSTYYTVSFLSFGIHFSTLSAGVDVEKYRKANPDPLDTIPGNFVPELGKQLGQGSYGTVHQIANSGFENFVQKTGDIENEAEIGQRIRDMRHNLTPQSRIADIQGLELVVPGKMMTDKSLILERVHGKTLYGFVKSFTNSWIDSPKKALERLCIFLNSLYAIGKSGIVHNDLQINNIMVEEKELPDEVIAAHVEAKARQRTGIIGEESDLTERNKRALEEARATARANLTFEDQYEYIPRIIDFGLSYIIDKEVSEEEAPQNTSDNMRALGALMPPFLFGDNGCKIIGFSHYKQIQKLQNRWGSTAKAELTQIWKDSEQPQDQLAAEIMSLEMKLRGPQRPMIKKEIADKRRIYKETYGDEYETKFEADLRKFTDMKKVDIKRDQYIMKKFHKANTKMRIAIGKSYPESVLEELAQITTDCLSIDPTRRPTAEEALEKVTNLLLSDWANEYYTIQPGTI
ncbi:MAG: hypothetical protein LBJ13_02195 [Puniceicoccales bacterium]|nr:hypothetical protein [Puniceicoccales bacterium]